MIEFLNFRHFRSFLILAHLLLLELFRDLEYYHRVLNVFLRSLLVRTLLSLGVDHALELNSHQIQMRFHAARSFFGLAVFNTGHNLPGG